MYYGRYDIRGFDRETGIHKDTGTIYDNKGYDKDGVNKDGFDMCGRHIKTRSIFDPEGYNSRGFNAEGIHKLTGTKYNPEGYDKNNLDRYGFRPSGSHYETNSKYDPKGYDRNRFNRDGIHEVTGTFFDPEGYDKKGYDKDGFNKEGINKDGFNREGFNVKTNSIYDSKGYDKDGYDKRGFNKEGIHKITGTSYDESGVDVNGKSLKKEQEEENKLLDLSIRIAEGTITISEYIRSTDKSPDELFKVFSNKLNLNRTQYVRFKEFIKEHKVYLIPFNEKKFLESTKYIVGKDIVAPTKEDVDLCIEYLKENDIYLCDYTIKKTVREYIQGILSIDKIKQKKKIK